MSNDGDLASESVNGAGAGDVLIMARKLQAAGVPGPYTLYVSGDYDADDVEAAARLEFAGQPLQVVRKDNLPPDSIVLAPRGSMG